jgi:hypothetical protein
MVAVDSRACAAAQGPAVLPGKPVSHPRVGDFFTGREDGRYIVRENYNN